MYEKLIKDLRENHGKYFARDMEAADAIEELGKQIETVQCVNISDLDCDSNQLCTCMGIVKKRLEAAEKRPCWIPVTERLPECDIGAEVGNIEWISNGMVHAGCFGRGGKYRDAYFRTWTDAGEGMDAKDADYWRAVTIPEPPKAVEAE